ncbi:phosphotransferase KptA/Tpt1 [Lepidopterella palustris CBS 459.81]|uniref:2'-phosphotransferase n=1 Tax=Lepidopterella palustris CBS 459.81 TaxID=1314670 RepID=A0A8E2E9P0_9PEZI|nr:phosphotransferase KptA/Tpt1 [Lepidopterella palustris CBS 459.81]
MSSRRGGRGGRGGRELPREVQVSKKISWLLRHGAGQEGLTLGEGGYVNVADALQTRCLKSLKVTFDELRTVVAENDKQRFSLIPVPSHPILASSTETVPAAESSDSSKVDESNPRNFLIRANQGHSINIGSDGLLTPITKDNMPEIVVHGTTTFAWPLIMKTGGLRRMGRNHVHFAQGLPKGFIPAEPIPGNGHDEDDIVGRGAKGKESGEAPQEAKENTLVISGMRNSSTILIYIDLAKALDAGIRFWKSENGVILSEGDEKGFVGCQFFKRVEERRGVPRILLQEGQ